MIRKNIFSILTALLLLFLSMVNPGTFQEVNLANFPNFDKVVHFGMYFVMMSVIILEHRKNIRNPSSLFLMALFPLSYGILIEILQATLTMTRSGDFVDALFDAAGILASVLLWLIIRPVWKEPVR
jgi:VanZ family protein